MNKHHTFRNLQTIQTYQIFGETMKKDDIDIDSSFTETKLVVEILAVESLTVVSK